MEKRAEAVTRSNLQERHNEREINLSVKGFQTVWNNNKKNAI